MNGRNESSLFGCFRVFQVASSGIALKEGNDSNHSSYTLQEGYSLVTCFHVCLSPRVIHGIEEMPHETTGLSRHL